MKKLLSMLGLLLLGSSMGLAQYTTVTATVVDSDSTTWANAPYSWSFQPGPNQSNPANYTYNGAALTAYSGSGTANGSGVISISSAIYDVTLIRPIGASYNITICPNASSVCSTVNFAPSSGSVSLSTQINAAIQAPRFHAVSGAYGYNDGEAILQLQPGSTYWNVTSSGNRCYSGSAWAACSGSGSGTVSNVTNALNFGVKSTNTAAQNQTAFATIAAAVNAGTTSATVYLSGNGTGSPTTYNVKSGSSSLAALGSYTVPVTFECSSTSDVIINQDSADTGWLIQLGATGLVSPALAWAPYTFKDCEVTGGASAAGGVKIPTLIDPAVVDGIFWYDYGSTTNWAIESFGINDVKVVNNTYIHDDNVLANFAYASAQSSTNWSMLEGSNDLVVCVISPTNSYNYPCGIGFRSDGFMEISNFRISGPMPAFDCTNKSTPNGNSCHISTGSLECYNLSGTTPCIEFGTPGSSSAETIYSLQVDNLAVDLGSNINVIGPAQSLSSLSNSSVTNIRDRTPVWVSPTVPVIGLNNLSGQTGNSLSQIKGFFGGLVSSGGNITPWDGNSAAAVAVAPYALLSEWLLNEGKGTTAYDVSSHTNNATWQGSALCGGLNYSSVAVYNYFPFSGCTGSTGTFALASYNAAQVPTTFTLSAWVLPTSILTYATILSDLTTGAPYYGYELGISGTLPVGKIHFTIANNSGTLTSADSATILAPNVYTHVCATYDGTTGKMYINGALDSVTITGAGTVGTSTVGVGVGGHNPRSGVYDPLPGYIEDARVYSGVVSCPLLFSNGPGGPQ